MCGSVQLCVVQESDERINVSEGDTNDDYNLEIRRKKR